MNVIREEAWMVDAACRGMDPELFHPHRGDRAGVAFAKRVCAGCPVMLECRGYARRNKLKQGVWGGETEKDRRPGRSSRRTVTTPERVARVAELEGLGYGLEATAGITGLTVRQVRACRVAARTACDCRPDDVCTHCDCNPQALAES